MDPQFALAELRLSDQYQLEGDLRRSNELAIKVSENQTRLPRYEQLALQALKARRSGDPEADVAAREQLVSEFPRQTFDRGILVAMLGGVGKKEQAQQVMQQGLALDPKNEDLLNFESYGLALEGDFSGALAANDSYMAIRPGDPNPLDTRGDILFMADRDDEAVATYRKVLELKPDFSDYSEYLKLAIVFTDQRKPDMANAAFQQYAHRASPLSRLYVPGFEAQFKQTAGDLEGALASYREAIRQLGQAKQSQAAETFLRQFAGLCLSCWEKVRLLFRLRNNRSSMIMNSERSRSCKPWRGTHPRHNKACNDSARSHPWIAPRALEIDQAFADIAAAVLVGMGKRP